MVNNKRRWMCEWNNDICTVSKPVCPPGRHVMKCASWPGSGTTFRCVPRKALMPERKPARKPVPSVDPVGGTNTEDDNSGQNVANISPEPYAEKGLKPPSKSRRGRKQKNDKRQKKRESKDAHLPEDKLDSTE